MLQKLVKIRGEDGERLGAIIAKIKEMRESSQLMDDECGSSTPVIKKKVEGSTHVKTSAHLYFKTPQRFDDCRLCTHLSATGENHPNLFDLHLSNYLTGCPKFIESTMEQRRSLVDKIKLCRQCFHPDVIFTSNHLKDCTVTQERKNAFSCTKARCKTHMWICLTHKKDNVEKMEKFRTDLQRKGFHLGVTSVNQNQPSQHKQKKLLYRIFLGEGAQNGKQLS